MIPRFPQLRCENLQRTKMVCEPSLITHIPTAIRIHIVSRTFLDVRAFKVICDRRRRPVFRGCKFDKMLAIFVTTLPPRDKSQWLSLHLNDAFSPWLATQSHNSVVSRGARNVFTGDRRISKKHQARLSLIPNPISVGKDIIEGLNYVVGILRLRMISRAIA